MRTCCYHLKCKKVLKKLAMRSHFYLNKMTVFLKIVPLSFVRVDHISTSGPASFRRTFKYQILKHAFSSHTFSASLQWLSADVFLKNVFWLRGICTTSAGKRWSVPDLPVFRDIWDSHNRLKIRKNRAPQAKKHFCAPANPLFPFENRHFLSHRPLKNRAKW